MAADNTLRYYLLAVCFVALVCAAITTGMICYRVVKIAAPELTLDSWSYSAHQSLDAFRRSQFNSANVKRPALYRPGSQSAGAIALNPGGRSNDSAQSMNPVTVSDAELEKLRLESYQQVIANHRRSALQDLVRLSIVLAVSAVLFATHWRMARKHRLTPRGDGRLPDGPGGGQNSEQAEPGARAVLPPYRWQ